jgi:hypothetical protein
VIPMIRSRRLSLCALLIVGGGVPAAVVACSSDGGTSSSGAAGGPDASATSTATSTSTSTATSTSTTPPPSDAGPDATSEAGACATKGESDVKPLTANSGSDPSGKVTVKMVDACDGTTASQAYAGARLKFFPTNGSNHYFLIDSTNPADFYKSASVVYNFPLAGIRNDTDVKLFAKPGTGGASDSFGANYDATKAHFVVQLNKVEATCDAGGFTVSVVGHAEAVVQYSNGGVFTPDGALTTSAGTQGAFAFISKVNPGAGLVDIVGTKTGCKLVGPAFPVAISTNKYPLIADTVTYLVGNTSL